MKNIKKKLISPALVQAKKKKGSQHLLWFVSNKEKGYLVENLTLLLVAGLNAGAALAAVGEELSSPTLKEIINEVKEEVESGTPLWRAMQDSRIFNPATIALVRVGEESGRLSENLKIAADQNEKNKTFRSKIKSALMYPVFVIILAAVVAIGVAWFILPRLSIVFSQMNADMPLVTKLLIDFGSFLRTSGYLFVPALIISLTAIGYFLFIYKKTKKIGQRLAFALPGFNRMIQEIELGRFGYLLGTLLKAGIPIEDALESAGSAADFYLYRDLAIHLRKNILEGESFQNSFASFKNLRRLVPGPVQQMIIAGEKSGNLADTLIKVGKVYEDKIDITTKNLVTILEPLLLIAVWLGVVGVALAIILPIYSLIGNLNS